MPKILVDTETVPFVLAMKNLQEYPPATYPFGNDIFRFSHYKYQPDRLESYIVHGFAVQEQLPYQRRPGGRIHAPRFGLVEYWIPYQDEASQIDEWIKFPDMSLPHLLLAISPDDVILESSETSPTLVTGAQFRDLRDATSQLNRQAPSANLTYLGSELTRGQWNRLLIPFNDQPLQGS